MISSARPDANPNCAETFASLRLYGDDLVPEEITRVLHLEATESAPKGRQTVSPTGRSRTAPTGRWILESQIHIHSSDLEKHIEWLLDRLDETGLVPANIPGVSRADVFCYWMSATGHGGPELSPEVLGRLAKYRLTLGLDIYFDPSST